jgi:hypothetical protein
VLTAKVPQADLPTKRGDHIRDRGLTGFHPTTVLFYVHRAGLPVQPTGSATKYDIGRHELVKLRRDGLMVKQIAERFGCSEGTVQRALRRYGLMVADLSTIQESDRCSAEWFIVWVVRTRGG